MHLERILIVNFCQHRYQVHNFAPGLTAIIGPNGSGKSNFMGAVIFAITGVNPNVGDKADNICQIAPPEEKSFVQLVFRHGALRATVTRYLRPNTKADLYLEPDGAPPLPHIKGDVAVNAKINEILGVDFGTVRDMVLVPQQEIFGFLDLIPSKRAASFQRLFKTDAAKLIHDTVNGFINATPPAPPGSAALARDELAKATETLQGWVAHLATQRALADIQAERDRALKLLGAYEARQSTREVIRSEGEQLSQLKAAASTVLARQGGYATERLAIASAVSGSREAFEAAKVALGNLANYRKMEAARQTLREARARDNAAMASLRVPVRPKGYLDAAARDARSNAAHTALSVCRSGLPVGLVPGTVEAQYEQLHAKLHSLEIPVPPNYYLPLSERQITVTAAWNALNDANQFLTTFEARGLAACPTCGTATANLADRIAATRASIPELEAAYAKAQQERAGSDAYDVAIDGYRNQKENWERTLAELSVQLDKLRQLPALQAEFDRVAVLANASRRYEADVATYNSELARLSKAISDAMAQEASLQTLDQPTSSEAELQALVNSQQEREKALAEYDRLIQQQDQELARLDGQFRQLAETVAHRQRSLEALADVSDEQYAAAGQDRVRLDGELSARQLADTNYATAQQAVAYWQQAYDQAVATEVEAGVIRGGLAHMSAVRDLFHHSNLPRFVSHRNLQRLQRTINDFLEMFDADFRVTADEGLSFQASFVDQRRQPAERLSYGQKVILALVFRLAVNSLFAENVGLIALDEPTAYLDERHIRGFEPVLAKLREFSSSRGLQCIMITHERGLAPLFDAVISL